MYGILEPMTLCDRTPFRQISKAETIMTDFGMVPVCGVRAADSQALFNFKDIVKDCLRCRFGCSVSGSIDDNNSRP